MASSCLILFDVDGTLIRGGPARHAFGIALQRVFGTAGRVDAHDFAGKTDPQIAHELLEATGLESHVIARRLPEAFQEYVRAFGPLLQNEPVEVLHGIRPLLDRLVENVGIRIGLVTGNIMDGARLKLESAELWDYFEVGGYGSDSADRNSLPRIAVDRATRLWDEEFSADRVIIVGDTPRDIACARAHGCRVIAVTTGSFDAKALAAADHVVSTLENLDELVDGIDQQLQ